MEELSPKNQSGPRSLITIDVDHESGHFDVKMTWSDGDSEQIGRELATIIIGLNDGHLLPNFQRAIANSNRLSPSYVAGHISAVLSQVAHANSSAVVPSTAGF